MAKVRLLILLLTIIVVGTAGIFMSYYARGYRFDTETLEFLPRGILVANSDPNGAQIFVNGELETATNATLSLSPGNYDIEIRKEGYYPWKKAIVIEKEVVTQLNASLFPVAPSLSAISFSGVVNPVASSDYSKFVYFITPESGNGQKPGLWVIESVNLPIGFNKEPRHVTDADLTEAMWAWSPDSREIMVTVKDAVYVLPASEFTPATELVSVATQKEVIAQEWKSQEQKRLANRLDKLPGAFAEILATSADRIEFSPDENKVLYLAQKEATIPENLKGQLPGSSTQKEERDIKPGTKYVYDIKEDRNFAVSENSETITRWMPNSNQLMEPKQGQIEAFDYDGTNRQVIYQGSYIYPYAYPYGTTSQMLISTNLGAEDRLPNLYLMNLK